MQTLRKNIVHIYIIYCIGSGKQVLVAQLVLKLPNSYFFTSHGPFMCCTLTAGGGGNISVYSQLVVVRTSMSASPYA